VCLLFSSSFGATAPQWARASSFTRFLDHTQRRTTVGRIPLDKWSARRRDLYLTTHNTHKRQTSLPPVRFEPTISASELPQSYILDCAATGTGIHFTSLFTKFKWQAQAIHVACTNEPGSIYGVLIKKSQGLRRVSNLAANIWIIPIILIIGKNCTEFNKFWNRPFQGTRLVEALRHKTERREFDSRCCHWKVSLT